MTADGDVMTQQDWYRAFLQAAAQIDAAERWGKEVEEELPPDEEPEDTEVPPSAIARLRLARPDLFSRGTS